MSDRPGERRSDGLLRSFVGDPGLWPVLLAGLASLSAFGAAALLLAVHDRNPAAIVAIGLLLLMSADVLRGDLRRRRFGPTSRCVVLLWGLSAAVAGAAVVSGIWH